MADTASQSAAIIIGAIFFFLALALWRVLPAGKGDPILNGSSSLGSYRANRSTSGSRSTTTSKPRSSIQSRPGASPSSSSVPQARVPDHSNEFSEADVELKKLLDDKVNRLIGLANISTIKNQARFDANVDKILQDEFKRLNDSLNYSTVEARVMVDHLIDKVSRLDEGAPPQISIVRKKASLLSKLTELKKFFQDDSIARAA